MGQWSLRVSNKDLVVKAFWDYTDAVFASSASPSVEKYRSIASSLGLSTEAITTCLAEGSPERALVSSHVREAQLLGINGNSRFSLS